MNETKSKLSQPELQRLEEIYNNCVEDQVEKYIHGDIVLDELDVLQEDNRQIFEQNVFLTSEIKELKEQNQVLQKQVSDSTYYTVGLGIGLFFVGIVVDRKIKSKK